MLIFHDFFGKNTDLGHLLDPVQDKIKYTTLTRPGAGSWSQNLQILAPAPAKVSAPRVSSSGSATVIDMLKL
jgi:hypothetical protein